MGQYTIHLAKEPFKFSCSHFTILSAQTAERLHGHNYQVRVDIAVDGIDAKLGMAFDFNAVKPLIRELCDRWDERILLPTKSPYLEIKTQGEQTLVRFGQKHYAFPTDDTFALPLTNITSEELARHLAEQLSLAMNHLSHWKALTTWVEETRGQSVSFHLSR